MKMYNSLKISILIMFIVLFAQAAHAATVMVSWSENSKSDLVGYRVYYGTSSRSYESILDVGNFTSVEIGSLTPGATYYISVTAYDDSGNESEHSEEVQVTIPAESSNLLSPGSASESGGASGGDSGGGGSCFISTSARENPVFPGAVFLMLGGMVLIGISSLSRK
jgi:uncharacterized membrane protein YgcG